MRYYEGASCTPKKKRDKNHHKILYDNSRMVTISSNVL